MSVLPQRTSTASTRHGGCSVPMHFFTPKHVHTWHRSCAQVAQHPSVMSPSRHCSSRITHQVAHICSLVKQDCMESRTSVTGAAMGSLAVAILSFETQCGPSSCPTGPWTDAWLDLCCRSFGVRIATATLPRVLALVMKALLTQVDL